VIISVVRPLIPAGTGHGIHGSHGFPFPLSVWSVWSVSTIVVGGAFDPPRHCRNANSVARSSSIRILSPSIEPSRYRIPGAAEETCALSRETHRLGAGPARLEFPAGHAHAETRRLLPFPPCGKMTIGRTGDGRPPAGQPRTNRADEQSDGRERRKRLRGMAGVNDRRPVILAVTPPRESPE
jgi:hypothetical protein